MLTSAFVEIVVNVRKTYDCTRSQLNRNDLWTSFLSWWWKCCCAWKLTLDRCKLGGDLVMKFMCLLCVRAERGYRRGVWIKIWYNWSCFSANDKIIIYGATITLFRCGLDRRHMIGVEKHVRDQTVQQIPRFLCRFWHKCGCSWAVVLYPSTKHLHYWTFEGGSRS